MEVHSGYKTQGMVVPPGSEALVSIIIPFYNQPDFVLEAVLSAKQQTFPNIEIIVVDDGSPIPVGPILKGVSSIQILRTENKGVAAARNLGVQMSSGDYLVFLDSDDRLAPDAVDFLLKALRDNPKANLSFGAVKIIDEAGDEVKAPHICRPRKDYLLTLLECNPISTGSAMIRKQAFIAAGGFNESIAYGEDYDLYLRMARQAPFVRQASCAMEYRKHRANISNNQGEILSSTLEILNRLEPALTDSERKRLSHGRRRWRHECGDRDRFLWRLSSLYFNFCALRDIPVQYWISTMT